MVYFMRRGDMNCFKIGYSKDPEFRRTQVQTEFSDTIELYAVIEGGFQLERKIQYMVASRRIAFEWFYLTPQEVDRILKLPDLQILDKEYPPLPLCKDDGRLHWRRDRTFVSLFYSPMWQPTRINSVIFNAVVGYIKIDRRVAGNDHDCSECGNAIGNLDLFLAVHADGSTSAVVCSDCATE